MKKIVIFIVTIMCASLISCEKKDVLEDSIGETNSVIVLIDDTLWNGDVGDCIRKKLTSSINGLPEEEALFNLLQYTEKNGDDHFCKNRNIIIIEKSTYNFFEVRSDDFALNQNTIYLAGKNSSDILSLIDENSDSIVATIQNFEIEETQRKIALDPLDPQKIQDQFEISLIIPSDFEYVSEQNHFLWLKKESLNGSSSLLIYQTPFFESSQQTELINKIIGVRDSIGKSYIQSKENEKICYMITEENYTPYFKITFLDSKKAFQTKGSWELKDVHMSGPFINYAIPDKKNNRVLILEGFVYAPSAPKRNMMHELEAIIKSVKFGVNN